LYRTDISLTFPNKSIDIDGMERPFSGFLLRGYSRLQLLGTWLIALLFTGILSAQDARITIPKESLKDTLFEKTVWHKKVSHIVLEEKKEKYHVTLLMISPYPHNYHSQNYALYYEYDSMEEAYHKFLWMDKFLKNNGVLRIRILGSRILEETILYNGDMVPVTSP